MLIKEGVLENPAPEAIIGLHVHPGLETGKFSFRAGKAMASADELYFTIKGKRWTCCITAFMCGSYFDCIKFDHCFATGGEPPQQSV
ncbi:MAG: hypothetical protein NVV59_12735 [Chitinophagaceae bacterium]|nr:hypothetical protein [Chitinophagaceae bacterium]